MENIGISPATIKTLSDKTNEKRKNASKEIERYVNKLVETKSEKLNEFLETIIKTYIQSNDLQMKKSGYIALAAFGLGLLIDHTAAVDFFPHLLKPVLEGMKENDTRAKFQACETMYNIAKSFRTIILPEINEIFKTLLKIIADTDENIKSIAVQLDSMLKDIVNEGLLDNKQFDLRSFMPVLVEKMKVKTPSILQMLISWIRILNSLPSLNLLSYLPTFLDELLEMEGEIKEIRTAADACLNEFSKELKENPKKRTVEMDSELVQILISKLITEKTNNVTKITAIMWLKQYLLMFEEELNQGNTNSNFNISILSRASSLLQGILLCKASENTTICDAAEGLNNIFLSIIQKSNPSKIKFGDMIGLLKNFLIKNQNNKTVITTIAWMKELLNRFENQVAHYLEDSLELVIEKLNDPDDEIVRFVGDLLGKFTYSQEKFQLVITRLLAFFKNRGTKESQKTHVIIKKLYNNLSVPINVFKALSAQLLTYQDCKFISSMVQKLDLILLTDKGLIEVRKTLRNLSSDVQKKQENTQLFESFYRTWCYNPVSTITLCFLTQQYELAYRIIKSFSDFEFEVDTLTQVAKLVQLLESPIFTYLRLQLLEIDRYPYLLKSLNGLMMILPQGKAFTSLKNRLKVVFIDKSAKPIEKVDENVIDIDKMMDIFIETQIRIKKWYKQQEEEHLNPEQPIKIDKIVKENVLEISLEKVRTE